MRISPPCSTWAAASRWATLRYSLHPPAQVRSALAAAESVELTAVLTQQIFIPRYGARRHPWFVGKIDRKAAHAREVRWAVRSRWAMGSWGHHGVWLQPLGLMVAEAMTERLAQRGEPGTHIPMNLNVGGQVRRRYVQARKAHSLISQDYDMRNLHQAWEKVQQNRGRASRNPPLPQPCGFAVGQATIAGWRSPG